MAYKTPHEHSEPFVVRPFVTFLDSVTDSETANDPIALSNLSEIGCTLGMLTLKKEEGEAIRQLKKEKLNAQVRVFRHYESIIQTQKIENPDFKNMKINERNLVKNEISRIIDRYIIRICTYSFRRAPLKMVSVNSDFETQLFFDINTIVIDAKQELEDILILYGV